MDEQQFAHWIEQNRDALFASQQCSRCGALITSEYGWHDLMYKMKDHQKEPHTLGSQTTLLGNRLVLGNEVKRRMPTLPLSFQAPQKKIAKPGSEGINLPLGSRAHFELTGGHDVDESGLVSVHVTYNGEPNNFPLNKTTGRLFIEQTGTADTDAWAGFGFDAIVVPKTNPQTKQQVPAWTVLRETIKKAQAPETEKKRR